MSERGLMMPSIVIQSAAKQLHILSLVVCSAGLDENVGGLSHNVCSLFNVQLQLTKKFSLVWQFSKLVLPEDINKLVRNIDMCLNNAMITYKVMILLIQDHG
jgi:hypothetical protein